MRVIVGLPAGLQPDIVARLVAQGLSERLGQPVIIENRPGAGGNIATELVDKSAVGRILASFDHRVRCLQCDALLEPYIQLCPRHRAGRHDLHTPFVMVVNPSVPAKTVPEFLANAKANPGKINMASSGIGTAPISSANYSR